MVEHDLAKVKTRVRFPSPAPDSKQVRPSASGRLLFFPGGSRAQDFLLSAMSILLSCRELSKSYGARPLFEGLSFGLFDNERTGLIGPNGSGKSTLLKILSGAEKQDSGEISVRRGLRVGYLPQRASAEEIAPGVTVGQTLFSALSDMGLEKYEIESRAAAGAERAGFQDLSAEACRLSGGWRKRLSVLAQVLREPDLLLLDEPTNHLDLEGVVWLENFMDGVKFPFLVVTHDRRFLEKICSRVIELDRMYPGGHFSSSGNYSKFLENREIFLDAQSSREESLRNTVRSEIEWLHRGARARTTKQKAHIDRAGRLMGELSELEYRNAQGRASVIDFTAGDRQGNMLAGLYGVSKTFGGRKLFGPLDLVLRPGDKLGLVGGNGSGKTTLLNILAGRLPPDEGTVRLADGLRVVAFDQHRDSLDMRRLAATATKLIADLFSVRSAGTSQSQAERFSKLTSGKGKSGLNTSDFLKVVVQMVDPSDVSAYFEVNSRNKKTGKYNNSSQFFNNGKGNFDSTVSEVNEAQNRFADPAELTD